MPLKKEKYPSSARRNIKQETFSPFVSSSRLQHVQSLLCDQSEQNSSPDALLIILGVDSRYNSGMTELVNYLLFDFFTSRKLELERSGYEDECIEDMVFVLRRDSVDVYCNPINYHYLLPYIAHWNNLTIHCLTHQELGDEDKMEEFKIQSFVNMVAPCNKIAIPVYRSGECGHFDKMEVEKWPLVQAYALDDFGSRGFFTMKHEVMDLSTYLHSIYHLQDPVSMETLVTQHLPLFERQWKSTMTNIDVQKQLAVKTFTEQSVCEPLTSFFTHGQLTPEHSPDIRRPFVAFGCHTSSETMQQSSFQGTDHTIYDTGLQGQPALHMVIQGSSPRSPLGCTRTYFFQTGFQSHPLSISEDVSVVNTRSDIRLLLGLYQACIKAVLHAIEVYTNTLDPSQVEEEVSKVLRNEVDRNQVTIPTDWLTKRNVKCKLEAFDNTNRRVSLRSGRRLALVKTLSVSVLDVPSVEHTGQTLGSVVFAESFLESTLYVLNKGEDRELDGRFVLLTRNIPYIATWQGDGKKEAFTEKLMTKPSTDLLGRQLVYGDNAQLLTDSTVKTISDGHVYFYEDGVVYRHTHVGNVVLPRSALENIQVYVGESGGSVVLVILTYKQSFSEHIPHQLRSDLNTLSLPVIPRTKMHKSLFNQILPLWRQQDTGPSVEMIDEVPYTLHPQYDLVQRQSEAKDLVSELKKAELCLPDLHQFLSHFAVSSVGEQNIPQRHVQAVLQQEKSDGSFQDENQIVLTVISGVPGSHHENLYNTLASLVKQQSDWVVIPHQSDIEQVFHKELFEDHLLSLWKTCRSVSHTTHVLTLLPGLANVTQLVQCIADLPNKQLASCVTIGAVTVCVNSESCFLDLHYTFPGLLQQCAPAWVNNVVFTTSKGGDEKQVRIKELIRAVNNDAAFFLAPEGNMTRSSDVDAVLSSAAFNSPLMIHNRYLTQPASSSSRGGASVAGSVHMMDVVVRFSQPLDRDRLINNIKGLQSSHSSFPFTDNIYDLRGRFLLSDGVYELRCTVVSGQLSLVACAPTDQEYYVTFTGVDLNTDKLRQWLRSCTIQKPVKKEHVTRAKLTQAEISAVCREHHLDNLPEGWFYNGASYVSLSGEKSTSHPDTEQHLANYLDEINQQVDEYNRQVDAQTYVDLFD